jgi:hypothetical protein
MSDTHQTTSPADANKAIITDSEGRAITIQKLSAIHRMRIFEAIGGELSQNALWLGYALSAASVTNIDGNAEAFPTTKRQMETMVSVLGDAGLDAIAKGYVENFSAGESGELDDIRPLPETQP